jgi:hypothetical protein
MEADNTERHNQGEHVRTGAVSARQLPFILAYSSFLSHCARFHMALAIISKGFRDGISIQ